MTFTVDPRHPSLEGHFPGRPVVPGVVLLDLACAEILQAHPGLAVAGLPVVKFTWPVLSGQTVTVASGPARDGRVAFTCTVAGVEVARGALVLS